MDKIFLTNQESSIINRGKTTKYVQLKKWTRQEDPVSAYLFISVLEVVFTVIRSNKTINGLKIFEYEYLYTAYDNDTTLFPQKSKNLL